MRRWSRKASGRRRFARLLLATARETARKRARLYARGVATALSPQKLEALRKSILEFNETVAAIAGCCGRCCTEGGVSGGDFVKLKPMIVAGVMSGTSADGIDVAVVRIAPVKGRPKLTLLAHEGFRYPAALRRAVLAAMNAKSTSTAELARLNWRLGLAYAEAVKATVEAAQGSARSDWMPWADAVSPGARGARMRARNLRARGRRARRR